MAYEPTPEQRKAIEAYVKGSLSPLIESVLTKQLGMAAVFMHEKLSEPTLAGGKLEPVHPNHRADLRYVRETLQMALPVLKNTPLREQIEASITGMTYIIDRTERGASGVEVLPPGVVPSREGFGKVDLTGIKRGPTRPAKTQRIAGVKGPDHG